MPRQENPREDTSRGQEPVEPRIGYSLRATPSRLRIQMNIVTKLP